MQNSIIIAGTGCITPFGRGVKQAFRKMIKGESCFTALPDSYGLVRKHRLCSKIPDKEINSLLPSRKFLRLPRYSKLVISTVAECLRDAGLEQIKKNVDPSRVGIFLGTSRGPQEAVESISLKLVNGRPQQINPLHFQETVYNAPLGHLSIYYGITGPCVAFSSGVASGLQALEVAASFLASGKIDLALVGGVDTMTKIYFRGMADMKVLSPKYGNREEVAPFAEDRSGTIVGEGGAFIALEREESNRARSGQKYAKLVSSAIASDAFSYYQNDTSGKGFEYAIRQCLLEGESGHKDIDLIIACASGQPDLDCAEWRGIMSIWGKEVNQVPVTSIKGISGDLGAATQILALVLCREIFEQGLIPGTCHTGPLDPDCPLKVLQESIKGQVSTVLINEASWGGINASVILQQI